MVLALVLVSAEVPAKASASVQPKANHAVSGSGQYTNSCKPGLFASSLNVILVFRWFLDRYSTGATK